MNIKCLNIIILGFLLLSIFYLYAEELQDAEAITNKAWNAYISKDYGKASELAQNCISKFKQEMDKEQKILNSVVTSLFIQADIARLQNQNDEAVKRYKKIIQEYPDIDIWDNYGNWYKAGIICNSRITDIKAGNIFGDYTSETLTNKAWDSFDKKDFNLTKLFADKCIELYEILALEQKEELNKLPTGKTIKQYQILNDVGTCHVILGEIYLALGNKDKAEIEYKKVLKEYTFSQCWDHRGWYWRPAALARDRLFSIRTGISLFDSSSETLTNEAWRNFNSRDYDGAVMFAKRCISLYTKDAKKQQKMLTKCPSGKFIPYYWALNNVGTCYFILGEIYLRQDNLKKAKGMYGKVITDYPFSQCWEPHGWYWKVAETCHKRLRAKLLRNI